MKIKDGGHIHLMGICGTAMASLAGILKHQGYKITGSDQNVYPPMSTQLESLGIDIMQGYVRENLEPRPDLVIVGNVISKHFDEAQALLESDIPYTSLPKAMGQFAISDKNSVVISGTHGKTTTTSMLAWVAEKNNLDPGFLIGGVPANFEKSFRSTQGDWFIIEGDEYDTAFFDKVPKFVHYRPKYVVITSLEFDHADIYDDLEQIKSVFRHLVNLVPEDGLIVAYADDENVLDVVKLAKCKVVTYGLKNGDYQATGREIKVGRNQFSVSKQGENLGDVAMKAFGPHNTLNALASFAMSKELNWDLRKTLQGLAEFKGVKRRQELIGEPGGVTVIEDFAHHPTAVELTLQSMRERYPNQKIFAVFEPRSATSRRNIFQKDYVKALSNADQTLIKRPFDQSKIEESERMSSTQLVADININGGNAFDFENIEDIVSQIATQAHSGDVIILMSNGGFDGIYTQLLEALESRSS